MPDIIDNAWGYGAVVFPRIAEWQGFIILDPESDEMKGAVEQAMTRIYQGMTLSPVKVEAEGALAAAIAESMKTGQMSKVAVFSSALSQFLDKRFWVIDAEESDDGMVTTVRPLKVTTPKEARDAINTAVMPLQLAQFLKATKKGP
jgi:hypothetical protein